MSEDRTSPPDREKRIENELRSLPSAAPDPSFQALLRSRFAAGELSSALSGVDAGWDPAVGNDPGSVDGGSVRPTGRFGEGSTDDILPSQGMFPGAAPGAGSERPKVLDFGAGRPERRSPVRRLWIFPAIAAAAVFLFLLVRPVPPELAPLQVSASGSGTLRVGDRSFPIDEVEQFQSLFLPGTQVTVAGDMSAELQMHVADDFTLVAIPGAEFTVPFPPRKGQQSFDVSMGEVRVATLPGLSGEAIEIGAPGTRVDVMGTTLAVIADTSSTCVCLLEGTAMMMMKDGGMAHVDPGMRRVMHMDPATPDEIVPIFGNERMKLEMLRTAVGPSK